MARRTKNRESLRLAVGRRMVGGGEERLSDCSPLAPSASPAAALSAATGVTCPNYACRRGSFGWAGQSSKRSFTQPAERGEDRSSIICAAGSSAPTPPPVTEGAAARTKQKELSRLDLPSRLPVWKREESKHGRL